jgi:ABC-type Na+ efflux pump permease subunit
MPTRRRRPGLIGPLAAWDLLRLVRRGQAMRARTLLAGGLLVVLTLFTVIHFWDESLVTVFTGTAQALTTQDSADFGNAFTLTVIFAQLAILCLLTPAYAAGAIAEEKERHTFTLLLVSDLSGWEIFAGLLAGRVVFMLGVLAAGLPVLALAMLYGGVSLAFVGMSYLITAATVVLLAALAAAGAAAATTFRGALLRGYFLAAAVLVGFGFPFASPAFVLPTLYHLQATSPDTFLWGGLGYAGCELLVALVATVYGVRRVRQFRAKPTRQQRAMRATGRPRPPRRPRPDRLPAEAWRRPPVSGRDPFRWKERYIQGTKRTLDDDSLRGALQAVGVMVGIVVGLFLLVAGATAFGALVSGSDRGLGAAGGLLFTAGLIGHAPYLLVAGAAAGRSVVVERQRNTLESLLAIPADRGDILRPKGRAAAATGVYWGLAAGACLPLGFVLAGDPLAAVPSLLLAAAGGPLAAALGVWLSVRCQTATRALLWWLPAAGGLVVAQVVLYRLAGDGWEVPAAMTALAAGVWLAVWRFWAAAERAFERYGRA